MDTVTWGPSAWFFLHTVSFNYPENPTLSDKKHYSDFFTNLKYILPCVYCRESYTAFLKNHPLSSNVLSSREKLTKWLYDIHNLVNDKLRNQYLNGESDHKVKKDPSFKNVCKFYEQFRAECGHKKMSCNKK